MHITLYIIILANNVNFISYIANLDQFYAISVYSQVGYPWGLLLHFPPLQLCPCRIFHSRIFSRPITTTILGDNPDGDNYPRRQPPTENTPRR